MKPKIRVYSIEYYKYLIDGCNSIGGMIFYHMEIEMIKFNQKNKEINND